MEMFEKITISLSEWIKKGLFFNSSHQVSSSDSSSDYSDDEVTCRGRSDPVETRPILSVREYLASLWPSLLFPCGSFCCKMLFLLV